MSSISTKTIAIVTISFLAGIGMANLPSALATSPDVGGDLAKKTFYVSIDEIKQNFVFADSFSGSYSKTVTLSDGTQRHVELTPMIHNGMQVIELKDTGGLTYTSLDGTTTNGKLMIQVKDQAASQAALKAQGWD
jgi:hypothetical protein